METMWRFVCIGIIFIIEKLAETSASTHWIITEDGRIQAQIDSDFTMRRPHDLMSFLQQEQRVDTLKELTERLQSQIGQLSTAWEELEGEEERRLQEEDEDCQGAPQPLAASDLYVSTMVGLDRPTVRMEDVLTPVDSVDTFQEPHCDDILEMDFSMHAFEHLDAMKERNNLRISQELGLLSAVAQNQDIRHFGHMVATTLATNHTSWVLHNLATVYWRIQGNAPKAVECVRRALKLAPREHKDIPLLNLGNILHQARKSKEAAVVLQAAVDHAENGVVTHFTLGNVHAVLGDYNRSVSCFENALKLQNSFEPALKSKHAILCHSKLEKGLTEHLQSLLVILQDLKEHQERQLQWLSLQEKILHEQALLEDKLSSRFYFEEHKRLSGDPTAEESCFQYEKDGRSFFTCSMQEPTVELPNSFHMDSSLSLESLVEIVQKQAEKLKDQISRTSKGPKSTITGDFHKPVWPPKYSAPVSFKPQSVKDGEDVPPSDCQPSDVRLLRPTGKPMSVYLPPENKGFE